MGEMRLNDDNNPLVSEVLNRQEWTGIGPTQLHKVCEQRVVPAKRVCRGGERRVLSSGQNARGPCDYGLVTRSGGVAQPTPTLIARTQSLDSADSREELAQQFR